MKNKKGFTIIEIIIAMTVLFVGILGIFSLFPAAFKMAELSKITTRMTLVGQSKMEELIAVGFKNLTPGTYNNIDLTHLIDDEALRNRFQNSQIVISTAEGHQSGEARNPLSSNSLLSKIEVVVRYEVGSGKEKTELFTTYLSNPAY